MQCAGGGSWTDLLDPPPGQITMRVESKRLSEPRRRFRATTLAQEHLTLDAHRGREVRVQVERIGRARDRAGIMTRGEIDLGHLDQDGGRPILAPDPRVDGDGLPESSRSGVYPGLRE